MVEAQPAIRQLLKLDFEPKVSQTIRRDFRQTINQNLKTQLLPFAEKQADAILQQYNHARTYLEQHLEKEAEDKIANNRRIQSEIQQKIVTYNQAVNSINSCLQSMQLSEHFLPLINAANFLSTPVQASHLSLTGVDISYPNGIVDTVGVEI
jgi:hypothetical protein